jgi:hypothetical protein
VLTVIKLFPLAAHRHETLNAEYSRKEYREAKFVNRMRIGREYLKLPERNGTITPQTGAS